MRPQAFGGQVFRVVEDNDMHPEGMCIPQENLIKLRTIASDGDPIAYWRLVDSWLHETLHGLIETSGMGWAIRRHLKMTKKVYEAFEEDFLVRLLTPALLSWLVTGGWLVLPPLPGKPRHRKAKA